MRALLLSFVLVGCTGGEPSAPVDSGPPCSVEVEWGRMQSGTFVAFHDGDTAEIVLGFQGFRFIDSVARIRSARAKSAWFKLQSTVEGSAPKATEVGPFEGTIGDDGALYVPNVQLFFNDLPMADLLGKHVSVIVVATVGGCAGRATANNLSLVRGGCMDADGGIASCDAGS